MKKSLNSKVDVHFNLKLIQRPSLNAKHILISDLIFYFLLKCICRYGYMCVQSKLFLFFLVHLLQKYKIFQSHREIKWKQKINRRNQSVFNFDCSCIFTGPWWWNEWEIPFDIRSICISFHCCFDWFTCKM